MQTSSHAIDRVSQGSEIHHDPATFLFWFPGLVKPGLALITPANLFVPGTNRDVHRIPVSTSLELNHGAAQGAKQPPQEQVDPNPHCYR